jgi:excisionase family DNA binding protein
MSFYSVKELARKAGLTPARVMDLCADGTIPASKPGGRDWLIKKGDGDAWLEAYKKNS